MNVPFVKVNNQQEFDKVVDKMQRETGFKLHESSKCGADSIYNVIGIDDDFDILLYDPSHDDNKHLKIISADEYLTGIKENFTLDDLEDGMVVKASDGELFLGLSGFLVNNKIKDYNDILDTFDENFEHKEHKCLSISKVYNIIDKNLNFYDMLNKNNLTLIFDAEAHRNKSKILQRKSEIENKIKNLQEELNNL